jgi:C4-dicarboxylate-binding protein DctP
MKKTVLYICLVVLLCVAIPFKASSGEKRIIRIAHELADTHPKHLGALKLKELVHQRLEGKIEVRVYGQGSLFRDTDALDAVMAGNLEMCMPLGGNFAKWIPEMRITSLPNLTNSYAELERFWTTADIGNYLKAKMKAKGIRYLGFTYSGGYDGGVMSNSRIVTLSDIKGKKIRIHSPSAKPFIIAWNANPIAISAAEISTALQRNTIDGALSSVPQWLKCCKDVAPYFTVGLAFVMPPHIVCTSQKFWDSLSPDVKPVLQQCIDEATQYSRGLKQKFDKDLISEHGTHSPAEKGIYLLKGKERAPWTEANLKSYPLFEKMLGAEIFSLAKKFMLAQ